MDRAGGIIADRLSDGLRRLLDVLTGGAVVRSSRLGYIPGLDRLTALIDKITETPGAQASGFFLATLLCHYYANWRRTIHRESAHLRAPRRPKEVDWLDDEAFASLVAICDTIIPRFTDAEVNCEELLDAFEKMSPGARQMKLFTPADVAKHRKHFMRGALDLKVAEFTALAFQGVVLKEDKQKLAQFLSLLSTSVGTLLLFGKAAPFHVSTNDGIICSFSATYDVAYMRLPESSIEG
jgi:hypothetical protein